MLLVRTAEHQAGIFAQVTFEGLEAKVAGAFYGRDFLIAVLASWGLRILLMGNKVPMVVIMPFVSPQADVTCVGDTDVHESEQNNNNNNNNNNNDTQCSTGRVNLSVVILNAYLLLLVFCLPFCFFFCLF